MDQFILTFLKNSSGKNFQQLADDFLLNYYTLVSKEGGILSTETLKSIHNALREGKLNDVVDHIKDALAAAEDSPLNIAVIGESGTGKSSFINALRGLSHDEEESAKVGVVETTMNRTPYQHPKYPKVTFWDLPGTGTLNFLPETYLETVGFSSYDFFIIISSSRFSLNDAILAQKIKESGKKFYFVRTKVDSDLYNEKRTKPTSFDKERVLQKIRDYCLANLSEIGVPEPWVFLVSNFDLDAFDFFRLEETLLKELPAHKRHVFALLLPNFSDVAIDMKKNFLKEMISLEAVKLAAVSFIPMMAFVSGFDLSRQEECLKAYRSYFGLDDKSIEEIAEKLDTSVQDIKGCIKCWDFWALVKDDSITAKALSGAESYCAISGGPTSAAFQFLKVYFLRLKFLNTVTEDAKILLRKML
uniref:T-cell-specific guanine nucleotide triphosphate-binding protein 2-like n=1 Tax=Jaculus jaculus TaxID=51337 RepID=UPI000333191A|nr:T-cell-specific guanine nucleotide triphosphate-binding protein 2-like [Jaculus jaculus]